MKQDSHRARGQLEADVMRILWNATEPQSSSEIRASFAAQPPTQTALLTVLDRLRRKGLVIRLEDSPRKLRFQASQKEQDHASATMMSILSQTTDPRATLVQFTGGLSGSDLEILRRVIADGE